MVIIPSKIQRNSDNRLLINSVSYMHIIGNLMFRIMLISDTDFEGCQYPDYRTAAFG